MAARVQDTRIVEVYASAIGNRLTLTWRRWYHRNSAERLEQETRMVRATLAVPPTNDDITKYAEAMARFCVDPRHRMFRAPNALVWREVAFGNDETREHGEARDGKQFIQDALPLNDGSTDPDGGGTILTAAEAEKSAPPKAASASAREPQIRTLGKGRRQSIPGG
jgi:hypothetical protein